jgi:polygalacturonase
VYDVTRYGARGDGLTDDAVAIQKAIDKAAEQGGTVVFPAGKTFLAGPVRLRGGVEYRLEPGSVLKATPDEGVYHISAFGKNEGEGMMWLWAQDEENLVIGGSGTIDGNGVAFMGEELEDSYDLKPVTDFDPRPHVLTFKGVNHVRIRDITIREGAY